ncbi:hypothetical protein LTR84_000652 [Exophiala bonariae]|uniref:Zn(2)-C6 fungal-type domain-containing protein n=1 Tax=Exophiala bonariae TaxID=1690606 RepID=A0AAV9NV76_9EURO|nr:hypothetical protein LTR84_000652 [Exophiala bonariae]
MESANGGGNLKRGDRACKPCKTLKVRCRPDPEGSDICRKCQRSGARCIFEQARPRKQRKVASDNATQAVAALETRITDLTSQLELEQHRRSHDHEKHSDKDVIAVNNPVKSQKVSSSADKQSISQHAPATSSCEPPRPSKSGPSHQDEHPIVRLLGEGRLSDNDATLFLSKYRQMCDYSPFVLIPKDATIKSMAHHQPFLLHAVLAISTQENRDLQKTFESSFRESLLRAVTIEGEKSIDLLQAFVVYLSWYHFFYIPMKQQFNQLLQIAISMCIDMGLDHPPSEAAARKIGLQLDHHYTLGGAQCDRFFSKAAIRAYLGCHYLSATSSWIWRKPNNLHCTEYLLECAESLAKDPEYATDPLILPLIQSQTLGDEYHEAFLSSNFNYSGTSCSARIKAKLDVFRSTIDEILLTTSASDRITLILATQFAISHAHEMDHLNPCLSNKHFVPGDIKDWASNTSSQHEVLMVCLQAATVFIETFLSLPLTEYPKLSVLQWWGLICNTAFLYRLSLGTPKLQQWNVSTARDAARLDLYLDLLCYRMQCITGSTSEIATGKDLFSLMCPIFSNVKNTYERLKKLPQSSSAIDEQPVHAKAFTAEFVAPGSNGPAFNIASTSALHTEVVNLHPHDLTSNPAILIKPSSCPAFRYWSQAPDLPENDQNDSTETGVEDMTAPAPIDINMFLDVTSGNDDAPWSFHDNVNWEFEQI